MTLSNARTGNRAFNGNQYPTTPRAAMLRISERVFNLLTFSLNRNNQEADDLRLTLQHRQDGVY